MKGGADESEMKRRKRNKPGLFRLTFPKGPHASTSFMTDDDAHAHTPSPGKGTPASTSSTDLIPTEEEVKDDDLFLEDLLDMPDEHDVDESSAVNPSVEGEGETGEGTEGKPFPLVPASKLCVPCPSWYSEVKPEDDGELTVNGVVPLFIVRISDDVRREFAETVLKHAVLERVYGTEDAEPDPIIRVPTVETADRLELAKHPFYIKLPVYRRFLTSLDYFLTLKNVSDEAIWDIALAYKIYNISLTLTPIEHQLWKSGDAEQRRIAAYVGIPVGKPMRLLMERHKVSLDDKGGILKAFLEIAGIPNSIPPSDTHSFIMSVRDKTKPTNWPERFGYVKKLVASLKKKIVIETPMVPLPSISSISSSSSSSSIAH